MMDGLSLTQAEADALFAADLAPYVAAVRAALAKPVPQPSFDACCSLCFNIGQPNFAQSSVVRLANAGDVPRAVEAFLMWNRPPEIVTCRQDQPHDCMTAFRSALRLHRNNSRAHRQRGISARLEL